MSGYIFGANDQVLHMGDLSQEHRFELHLHGYHMATAWNSGQTWKVVVVHFHWSGHKCLK